MSMHHTHSTSTSRLSSEATTSTSESQSTLSATSEVTKHNGTPAQSEKRLPDTGGLNKTKWITRWRYDIISCLGLMKRKKKKDENDQDDSQA